MISCVFIDVAEHMTIIHDGTGEAWFSAYALLSEARQVLWDFFEYESQ